MSKEVVAEECGLISEGYLVTDLNPTTLGLNIVEPEIITPENLFGEDLNFQFYELSSPSQIQSAWHMEKSNLRLIVIDELHIQNIQDSDQIGNTGNRNVHSATEENESAEILTDEKSDTSSTMASWFHFDNAAVRFIQRLINGCETGFFELRAGICP